MKVHIEIAGLPLYKTFGKSKNIEFEFPGETLKELMDALVEPPRAEVRGSSTCFVGRTPPKHTPLRSYELRRVPSTHSSTVSKTVAFCVGGLENLDSK